MHETKLDHLLRVTAPRSDWSAPAPLRNADDRSAFDDHLAHAATAKKPEKPVSPSAEQRVASDPAVAPASTEGSPLPGEDERATPSASDSAVVQEEEEKPGGSEAEAANNGATSPAIDEAPSKGECDNDDEATSSEQEGESDAASVADQPVTPKDKLEIQIVATERIDGIEDEAAAETPKNVGPEPNTKLGIEKAIAQSNVDGAAPAQPTGGNGADDPAVAAETVPIEGAAAPENSQLRRHTRLAAAVARNQNESAPRMQAGDSQSPILLEDVVADEVEAQQPAAEATQTDGASGEQQATSDTHREPQTRHAGVRQKYSDDIAAAMVEAKTVAATGAVKSEVADGIASDVTNAEAIDSSNRPTSPTSSKTEAILNPFTKLQAATHGHRGGTATEADKLPPVDPARFVGRVARAFHTAQERGGSLQLRLSPPELGALRLELVVKDGVLAATLETETPAARRVLLDHLPALRDRLTEQNIRIERFDVDVRRDGGGQQPSTQQQQREHQSPHWTAPRNPTARGDHSAESAVATAGVRASDSQINLVV